MSKYSEQIKSFGDDYLLQTRNSNRILYKFFNGIFWFCIFFGIPCLILGIYAAIDNGFENIFSDFELSLIFLAGAVFFRFLANVSRSGLHDINVEFARRGLDQYVDQDFQKDSKAAFKWGFIILVAVIIVGVIIGLRMGGDPDYTRCPECGSLYDTGKGGADYIDKYGKCAKCDYYD